MPKPNGGGLLIKTHEMGGFLCGLLRKSYGKAQVARSKLTHLIPYAAPPLGSPGWIRWPWARPPLALGATAGLLIVVALLAGILPAHRAMKVDPVSALRAE